MPLPHHTHTHIHTGSEACGSDGKTYASLCELLQASPGVKVKYGGKCNDKKCSSGEVSQGIKVCISHMKFALEQINSFNFT